MFNSDNYYDFTEHDDILLNIGHGEKTLKAIKELSDFVLSLDIKRSEYDKLLQLMKNHLFIAEQEQFTRGFDSGTKLIKEWFKDRNDER